MQLNLMRTWIQYHFTKHHPVSPLYLHLWNRLGHSQFFSFLNRAHRSTTDLFSPKLITNQNLNYLPRDLFASKCFSSSTTTGMQFPYRVFSLSAKRASSIHLATISLLVQYVCFSKASFTSRELCLSLSCRDMRNQLISRCSNAEATHENNLHPKVLERREVGNKTSLSSQFTIDNSQRRSHQVDITVHIFFYTDLLLFSLQPSDGSAPMS